MAVRSGLLAAVAALVVAVPAAAAGKIINPVAVREMSRPGPCTVELQGKGTIRVPTGFRYVGPDRLSDFHELAGDPTMPGELGAIVPDDGTFVVYLALITDAKDNPLTGLTPEEIATDAVRATLQKWVEASVAESSAKRAGVGLSSQKVMGWTHTPAYDEAKKRLTLGVRVIDEAAGPGDKDELQHRTYIYGPDQQVVLLRLVTSQFKKLDPSLEATKQLAGELTLTQPEEAAENGAMMHYAKIGGAGLLGVVLALVGAKLLMSQKRRTAPAARPAAARKFGSPR